MWAVQPRLGSETRTSLRAFIRLRVEPANLDRSVHQRRTLPYSPPGCRNDVAKDRPKGELRKVAAARLVTIDTQLTEAVVGLPVGAARIQHPRPKGSGFLSMARTMQDDLSEDDKGLKRSLLVTRVVQ